MTCVRDAVTPAQLMSQRSRCSDGAKGGKASPIPVAVVMKLTSQKRRKLPPRRQGPKTMEVVTRDRKKKMVISSTILNSRYVLGRYSPSLRSLRAHTQAHMLRNATGSAWAAYWLQAGQLCQPSTKPRAGGTGPWQHT